MTTYLTNMNTFYQTDGAGSNTSATQDPRRFDPTHQRPENTFTHTDLRHRSPADDALALFYTPRQSLRMERDSQL
jgi:hypothetical protein